jgi:hypothetical protein
MNRWSKRLRLAMRVPLIWAALWASVGAVVARLPGVYSDLPLPILFAALGGVTGLIFAILLLVVGSRAAVGGTPVWRCAGLGLLSGLLLCGCILLGAAVRGDSVWAEFLLFGPGLIVAGGGCGAGYGYRRTILKANGHQRV